MGFERGGAEDDLGKRKTRSVLRDSRMRATKVRTKFLSAPSSWSALSPRESRNPLQAGNTWRSVRMTSEADSVFWMPAKLTASALRETERL